MPGGGKSTIGRQLARRMGLPFADTDIYLEERIGCPIRDFFEREGEARFRDLEVEILGELVGQRRCVLATGGGIVLRGENREALRHHTHCIYLRSSPEELFRRLRHDTKRPLLQVADPLGRLRELHARRDALYAESAHYIVDTGRPSIPTLVNMIVMQLELAGGEAPAGDPDPI